MLRIKNLFLPGIILFSFCTTEKSWAVVTDTSEKLIIPVGESYTLSGNHSYSQSIEIYGTLFVKAFDALVDSGCLGLSAPNITIAAGGSINANGRGFRGGFGVYNKGEGPGGGTCGGNGGGAAYGGDNIGAIPYGSIINPTDLGSGGGGGNGGAWGGSGGGNILINITEKLVNNGIICSNGQNGGTSDFGNAGGGGSGGSIYISAGDISGSGTISANGGSSSGGGCGAGGRIAVYYGSNNFTGNISAYGEKQYTVCGGAGTIYTKSSSQSYGSLIINNNGKDGGNTFIIGQFDTVTIDKNAVVKSTTALSATQLHVVSSGVFVNSGNMVITNAAISSKAILYQQGGQAAVTGTMQIGQSGCVSIDAPMAIAALNVLSGGMVTHSFTDKDFQLTVSNDLIINSGGEINVNGKGYRGGTYLTTGDGEGPGGGLKGSCYGGGAGYGGNGGQGSNRPSIDGGMYGEAYGSMTEPGELGSGGGRGGGNDTQGGNGGGKIKLIVSGNTINDGTISSNGLNGDLGWSSGYSGGGGSGGSIYILTSSFSGSGKITVNGGNGGNLSAGGGSGGRIAIYCNSNSYSGIFEAKPGAGGATAAQTGTIVVPSSDPSSPINISDSPINFMQNADLNETVSNQTAEFTLNATGDLDGTFNFANTKITTIKTGAFSNKGFMKADWNGQLEGVNYNGSLKAVTYLDALQRKIYIKGSIEGDVRGIIDGYLVESFAQSNTYDQFFATWTFRSPRTDGQYSSGISSLQGVCEYLQYQEHPGINLKLIQTSSLGNVSGSYTGSINTVLTSVSIKDPLYPDNGEGFCMMSYQAGTNEGKGWCFSKALMTGEAELSGMISSPLLGILQGTLITTDPEKKLWLIISRLDIGIEPKAELQLEVFNRNTASPGGMVSYTIRVKNVGLVPAQNIKVQMSLPLEARFLAASGDYQYINGAEGDFVLYPDPAHGPESISWLLPVIPAQSTYFYDVQAKVIWGVGSNTQLDAKCGIYYYNPNYFSQ